MISRGGQAERKQSIIAADVGWLWLSGVGKQSIIVADVRWFW